MLPHHDAGIEGADGGVKKAIAISHAMRKLLHLAFAVWKTGKPFDPQHYPWQTPAQVDGEENVGQAFLPAAADSHVCPTPTPTSDTLLSQPNQAAGHTLVEPARTVVTAACAESLPQQPPPHQHAFLDFAHLKRQLPIGRVLDQFGLTPRLRGNGPQQRCACPIHRDDARGRTFSVHLDNNVFQCFDKKCGKKGDVIDLWANVRGLSLRDAALDLVRTFGLEPAPPHGTEKRNG